MNLEEWTSYHDKHAAKRNAATRRHPIAQNVQTEVHPDNGAFLWAINGDTLQVIGIVGNRKYWDDRAVDLCRINGLRYILAFSAVPPEVFERAFKMKNTRTWYEYIREVT